jgi:2-iminobutanoate/2-iminopropanoate deaminase
MKEAVKTDKAPEAIGPYSQAVIVGGFIFISGQIPIDPRTGNVAGETIEEQTRKVMQNIGAILEASGSTMGNLIKTTIYMTDIKSFSKMNSVYEEFLNPPYPARATVGVSNLPKGVEIEIDAVATIE